MAQGGLSIDSVWAMDSSGTLTSLAVWSLSVCDEYMLVPRGCQVAVLAPGTGQLLRLLRGHARPVIATLVVPGMFASGDVGGVVILWTPSTGEAICKYAHSTRVVALLAQGACILSGSGDSIGFWTATQELVEKIKTNTAAVVSLVATTQNTVLCALSDKQVCLIENRKISKKKIYMPGTIFALHAMKSDPSIVLAAIWDPSCVLLVRDGEPQDKLSLPFQPLCVASFTNGLFCVGGTSGQILLCSKEVVLAAVVSAEPSWITCMHISEDLLTYGTASGGVKQIRVNLNEEKIIFGSHRSSTIYRDPKRLDRALINSGMNLYADGLITHCAVYGNTVAILSINHTCQVYSGDVLVSTFHINHPCENLLVGAMHVLTRGTQLSAISFTGEQVREWNNGPFVFAKLIDGLPGKESLIVSLSDGKILLLFLDNAQAALTILEHENPVEWADINSMKSILALINNYGHFFVYSLENLTPTIITQFTNISSAAFSTANRILLANESIIHLWIPQNTRKLFRQRFSGVILACTGSNALVFKNGTISTESIVFSDSEASI